MSFQQSSSFSFSATASSSGGQSAGKAFKQESFSDQQGTSVRTTSQNLGQPAVEKTKHYDSSGRELVGSGSSADSGGNRRIEDVTDETDADRRYREAMEDEYAKREGGA